MRLVRRNLTSPILDSLISPPTDWSHFLNEFLATCWRSATRGSTPSVLGAMHIYKCLILSFFPVAGRTKIDPDSLLVEQEETLGSLSYVLSVIGETPFA